MNIPAAPAGRALDVPALESGPALTVPETASSGLDVQRLQAQLARAVEEDFPGEERPRLRALADLLRKLLAAQAVGWLEEPAGAGVLPDAISASRPGAGAALAGKRSALDRQRATVSAGPEANTYLLSAPVAQEGRLRGWLLAQLSVANPRDLQALLVLLQMAAGYVLYRSERQTGAQLSGVLERASGLLEIFRTAGAELDFDRAARQATDALRDELGCRRVTLAYRRRRQVRIEAISGVARLDWKSAEHQLLEAAIAEALTARMPMEWTPDTPGRPDNAAHELLGQQADAGRLLTLPLPRGRGALVLEWAPGATGSARLAAASAEFVPVLFDLLERARPHPVLFSARQTWAHLSARQRRLWLAGLGLTAAILAMPFPYALHVECRLAPVIKQVVAAPFQGQLKRSLIRPGDRVHEGDRLGEIDSRELKLKEAELLAARERAAKQRDRAMANEGEGADFAAAQVANYEAQSVSQELALVQRKLSLLEVRAPLSGTVVSGDLRRAEGQPLQQGQVLWEIAPLEEMIVELEVPDRDVSQVRTGAPVQVRLEAFSGSHWSTTLQRLHPQSEAQEGHNVFLGEAPIPSHGVELRPGMRGRATIETARHPLGWILGHRLWEWLVTSLFW